MVIGSPVDECLSLLAPERCGKKHSVPKDGIALEECTVLFAPATTAVAYVEGRMERLLNMLGLVEIDDTAHACNGYLTIVLAH